MDELVSIIVPVYNVEKYLSDCINSIINQTYKNIEIILIDDGSNDTSPNICDQYEKKDNRIRVIHKQNEGVSIARNVGLKNAIGDWIAFVDSDDWLELNYLEELVAVAKKNNADVVLCGYNRIIQSKKEIINNSGKVIINNSREYLINTLNPQTGYGFGPMKLYKKEIIKDITFDSSLKVAEDALFNAKIATNISKSCYLEKSLYNYRMNSNSAVKKYDKNYANKYLKSMKTNKKYLLEKYNADTEIYQNYCNFVAFHILLIAVNFCYNSNNKNQRETLKEVCNYPEFKECIMKSNYNNMSITRKITLFTIKHKLYCFTGLICKIRNKQNNG